MRSNEPSTNSLVLFETTWGWCGARMGPGGIEAFQLPVTSVQRASKLMRERLGDGAPQRHPKIDRFPLGKSLPTDPFSAAVVCQVREYFEGTRRSFDLEADWGSATPFRRKVWRALCRVAYGSRVTYSDLAHSIGRPQGARAVGGALAANPVPLIVPCHRVLSTGGGLGGFSGEGGVTMKQRLLDFESGSSADVS